MFKEEQLDMSRSLGALSHVKQMKELWRLALDENWREGGGDRMAPP